jgi:hypothetical protein
MKTKTTKSKWMRMIDGIFPDAGHPRIDGRRPTFGTRDSKRTDVALVSLWKLCGRRELLARLSEQQRQQLSGLRTRVAGHGMKLAGRF